METYNGKGWTLASLRAECRMRGIPGVASRSREGLVEDLRVSDRVRGFYNSLGRRVTDFVLAHGGCWSNPECRSLGLELPTVLGMLHVSVVDDWIACRFADPARAVAHFGPRTSRLNPHSGKWNFGCGEAASADDVFAEWERAVRCAEILATP